MRKLPSVDLFALSQFPPADARLFTDWAYAQRMENDLDPRVLKHPRTCMLRARTGENPLAMLPAQPVLMLESLVHAPDASRAQVAQALAAIDAAVSHLMQATGMHEAFFQTRNAALMRLARSRGWHITLHDSENGTYLMKRTHVDSH